MVRRVTEEDIPTLVPLMRAYIVDFYRRPDPGAQKIAAFMQNLLTHPELGCQWVAEVSGEMLGFATCYFTFSTLSLKRITVLNDLYVAPSARGRHLGEELFRTCLDRVHTEDLGPMLWETAHDNHVAQGLYRKMGGQESPWLHYELE